jgi:hypothetical protein
MYCSVCGQPLAPGQQACPQCGRPAVAPIPLVPNFEFQLANYASRVRALSTVWFIYGGLGLVVGVLGMTFANAFLTGGFGMWMRGGPWGRTPFGPNFGPAFLHFIWVMIILRSALAFAAGYGLMERAPWGRVVAIVAAFLNLIKIPFGTAIGIWTLLTLLGYRNTTLYDQL